jgi:ATP-dependent Lon protease
MNKRKPDDEFARIDLSYFRNDGTEVVVYCPESKDAPATQTPSRRSLEQVNGKKMTAKHADKPSSAPLPEKLAPVGDVKAQAPPPLKQKHFTIRYDDRGFSFENMFGEYLSGAKKMVVEDPYIRMQHQVANFVRLCELVAHQGTIRHVELITGYDDDVQKAETSQRLSDLAESLKDVDIELQIRFDSHLHDRAIKLDNGWIIKIGRGLDIYQKPESWFEIGANDLNLRRCLETNVDIFQIQ